MSSRAKRLVVEIILGIIIIGLSYYLYRTIREPAERLALQEELTEQTRNRMEDIRTAMIRYENENERYPTTLDSLVMFVEQDSSVQAQMDSLFGANFNPDSLPYSPRTGNRFVLQVNDTADVETYRLQDPDRESDYIGTVSSDITELNAASWE